MNKKALLRVLCACLVLMAVAAVPRIFANAVSVQPPLDRLSAAWNNLTAASAAEQSVQRAWLLAQVSGTYKFHTELEQTTYYPPALANVGRPAQIDNLYLEGQTDVKNQTLQLALWQGGSVLKPADAIEMRVEQGKAYGRTAGGAWQAINDFSGVFAPDQDPLAYLHGAKDMREVTPPGSAYRQYSFTSDGPAFAEYIRQQLEDELRRSGKLPASVTLDTARVYRDMIGNGQLWISAAGLPLRLEMNIDLPQQSDGSRIKASIRNDFSDFAQLEANAYGNTPLMHTMLDPNIPPFLANLAARLWLVDWPSVAGGLAMGLTVGTAMVTLLVMRRRRRVYAFLSLCVIASMIFNPAFEATRIYAYSQEQATARQKYDADQAKQQAERDLKERVFKDWNPSQDPLAAAEARAQQVIPSLTLTSLQNPVGVQAISSSGSPTVDIDQDGVPDAEEPTECVGKPDCDNDTLTDLQESRLGTRLDKPDSDGDSLRDDMEVKGFGATDKTLAGRWYSDPNNLDTNLDGLPDNQECWADNTFASITIWPSNTPCDKESDTDGLPDVFDEDNDNDGIDDLRDLSPFNASPVTYNKDIPFNLQVTGLTPNEPLFVDIQLAPTSRNQVSYARNVLDWPTGDTEGQIQRATNMTFADSLTSAQRQADPSAENGDMRLVPLVEIKIPATDASNLLPKTQTVTTTRSATGYYAITTGSGDTAKTDLQVWLQARVEFRAQSGGTTLAFTSLKDNAGANITIDRVKLFNTSNCPVSSEAAPQYAKSTSTTAGDVWNVGFSVRLPNLLDGKHVLMLEQGSGSTQMTACLPLGDVPNGKLDSGWMFDSAKLDPYGVSLRDVVDANQVTTYVVVYAPANVVVGRTGGEKQAFAARIPYWPGAGITSLGAAQEVRLIWLVQMLDDDGRIQVIHTYANEAWKLGGLSARQDIAVRSAVLYQNPDYIGATSQDRLIHSYIWKAAQVMGAHFAVDRIGKERLVLDGNLLVNLQNKYQFPVGSLEVVPATYETQDEVARIPKEVTNDIILPKFVTGGTYKAGYTHALLLFAREEDYKSVVWSGGTLSLPTASSTLASYNWKPFRYTSSGWEPYPVQDYLDLVGVAMSDIIQAGWPGMPNLGPDPVAARSGMVLADQMYALGMFYGGNQMVNVQGKLIENPAEEEDSTIETIGKDGVGKMLGFVADQLVEDFAENFTLKPNQTAVGGWAGFGNALKGKFTEGLGAPGALVKVKAGAAIGLNVASFTMGAAALSLAIASLAGSDVAQATDIIKTVTAALDIVASVVSVVDAVKSARAATSTAGGLLNAIKSAANAVSRAATIAAVVGMVISSSVAVGIFVTQWAVGAFGVTDLAFTAALATMVTGIIVAVIMFAIMLIPVIGQVIAAVIALIDAVISGICAVSKAAGYDLEKNTQVELPGSGGNKLSFCAGLSGLMGTAIQWSIFSQNVLVGNMQDEHRLNISNFRLNLVNQDVGFQVGNSIKPTLRVDNKINLIHQPGDWKSAVYFWQINWDILDNATHRYDLTVEETDRSVGLSEMESEWQEIGTSGQLTGGHRSPGIQYQDPLYMTPANVQLAQGLNTITFTQAGINVSLPLYLREAYANPTQECIVVPVVVPPVIYPLPVCYIRSDSGTNHLDFSQSYDIFPATLDEFYAPVSKGGGASLDWGQIGEVTFSAMADFDGDGLRSPAYGGNDPDDRYWDIDNDGLSDPFEMEHGTSPTLIDTDNDGLTDRQEILRGGNPNRADNDGDGLLDCEETFHQVQAVDQYARCGQVSQWRGGWSFVYDLKDGVSQTTWVNSAPQQLDSDGDTLTDYQEKLYGLHPLVKSDPAILKLESQVREVNAPALLLRFEERAGANLFGDTSGLLNNATCTGTSCPIAGYEGRYTNGLVFDGVNDQLVITSSMALANASFTLAVWAKRTDTLTTDQWVFTSGAGQNNQGLHLGFRNNQFLCAFWNNDLITPLAYPDTNWHQWACTYNATTRQRTIYRDGVQVAQDIALANYQGSGAWHIGGRFDNFNFFNGLLDEVAVFQTALNAAQIQDVRDARYNLGGAQVLVKPGDTLRYDATLTNNLLGKQLTGLLDVQAPPAWAKAMAPITYQLGPAQSQKIQGDVSVAGSATSGAYSLTLTAGTAASDPATNTPQPPLPLPFAAPAGFWDKWTFDGNYVDSSGNNLNGTPKWVYAPPAFVTGFKNQSVDLNNNTGYHNYVTLPSNVVDTIDFTFATWIYWRGGNDWQRIFDFGQDTYKYMLLSPSGNGSMQFWITTNSHDDAQKISTDRLPMNTWVHVAVTIQGNTGKIYVNGVEKASSTNFTLDPNQIKGANTWLGKSQYSEDPYFNGRLDEVYIYRRALSAGEVQQLALSGVTDIDDRDTGDAAVYLTFDSHYLDYNSTNDWRNPQGNAVPAGTTSAQPFTSGRENMALNLDGTGSYATLPSAVANASDFTFAAWIYWRGGGDWQRIFDFGQGTGSNMYLTPNGDSHMHFAITTGGSNNEQALNTSPLPINTWVHLAVTLQGNTARLYMNGVEKISNSSVTLNPNQIMGTNTWLGKSQYGDDPYFNGLLDEVHIYHRALSTTDINSLIQKASLQQDVRFTFNDANPRLYRFGNGSVRVAREQAGSVQTTGGVDGKQALAFDGKTALGLASSAVNIQSLPFTYAVWVKPDANNASGTRTIFGQPPTGARDWADTTAGVFLRLRDGKDLLFGWGGQSGWSTDLILNATTLGTWNHVAVTGDGATVRVYVNGDLKGAKSYNSQTPPPSNGQLLLGASNLCAQVTLSKFYAYWQNDGDSRSEFLFSSYDSQGAIASYWQGGIGNQSMSYPQPKSGETVATLCGAGGSIHLQETDASSSDDHFNPNAPLDFYDTPGEHTTRVIAPDDGDVAIYYVLASRSQPFAGALDDFSLSHRAMTEEEIQLLYIAGALPYHFTLDDPPGAGLNANQFNFKNEGAIANSQARGICAPGACPTSGLPGRINQAVQFQSNQSIQLSNLDLPATPPGFSVWANPAANGQLAKIWKDGYALTLSRSGNAFCLNGSCANGTYSAGQWYHLMISFDQPGQAALYINGQRGLAVSNTWGGAGFYNAVMGGGFSGLLDDFRVPYDTRAISRMMAAAPIVSLHLQETGTGVTSFASLGGSPATCTGNTCPKAGVKGKVSHAARFDGIDDGLSIPDSAQLDLDQFTVAVWVKPAAGQNLSGWQTLVAKADNDHRNYALYLTQERKIYATRYCGGPIIELTSNAEVPLDQYTHVAFAYDGKVFNLYVNGVLDKTLSGTLSGCQNNMPLMAGKPSNGNLSLYRTFNGDLDEIQVYNYALYTYQIKNIFEFQANWIEEENAYNVIVDGDNPTSTLTGTLPSLTTYYANADVQLGVKAQDPTSAVALLELGLSRNNSLTTWTASEACQDAAGGTVSTSATWCPWFNPTSLGGEGRYTVQTRATDAVGNRETPAVGRIILVDATGPIVTTVQTGGSLQTLRLDPSQANTQILALNGTVNDPNLSSGDVGSGVNQVGVTLRDADGKVVGNAPYPAQLVGMAWSLNYPFLQAQVSGPYYLQVTASDRMGNATTLPVRTLYLDGTAPGMELDEVSSGLSLTRTTVSFVTMTTTLRGVISERPFPSGAQLVYHFEENANATSFANAVASSGWQTAGNAICSNATCPIAGNPGRTGLGLLFDGMNDEIVSKVTTSLANASFSVALWAKRSNTLTTDQFIFTSGTSQNNQGLHLGFRNNQFLCAFWNNDLITADTYGDTNWHHWACTYNASTRQRTIYRDGVQVAQDIASANYQGNGDWHIGGTFNNTSYFNGTLDEVAVYARTLNAHEIRVLAAPQVSSLQAAAVSFTPLWADSSTGAVSPYLTPSLVSQTLYLPLDDARSQSPTVVYRNVANSTMPAGCLSANCPAPAGNSPAGTAVNFDGKDDYVNLPQSLAQTEDFSFAAWVYWRGGNAWQRIFDLGRDTTRYMFLTPSNGSVMRFVVKNGGVEQSLDSATPLTLNAWNHVAVTLQGDTGRLYMNGVQVAAQPITLNPSQIAGVNNWLGRSQYSWDPYLNGQLNDVRTFARALSDAEIQSLWRGSRALLSLPLDEPFISGSSPLPDTSGWKRTVTLNAGAGDTVNKAVPGITGPSALKLDGIDDQVIIADSSALRLDRFTLSLWVNPAQIKAAWQPLLIKSDADSGNRNYALLIIPNTTQIHYFVSKADCATNVMADSNISLPLNAWSHVALVYDGVNLALYVNGVVDRITPLTGGLCQRANAVRLGWVQAGDWWAGFSGMLDQVNIYPRALNSAEIADMAHANWRTVTVSGQQANWSLPIPIGLEGIYRLDLRGVDAANPNHYSFNGQKAAFNQTVDSLVPRVTLTQTTGGTWGTQYRYRFSAEDLYLSKTGLSTPCGNSGTTIENKRIDPANNDSVLNKLVIECTLAQRPALESATVCDMAGNCTTTSASVAAPSNQAVGSQSIESAAPSLTSNEPTPIVQPADSASNASVAPLPITPVDPSVALITGDGVTGQPESAPLRPQATVLVTSTNDSGPGSLRQAISDAVAGDTITFDSGLSGMTITLAATLTIDRNLTIDGSSLAIPISISGNDAVRVFYVADVTAELRSLKVVHGYQPDNPGNNEGAGLVNYGALTLVNTTFDSNSSAFQGGALTNFNALTVKDSTFSNNHAVFCGAGINNGGSLIVLASTFVANRANDCGGAISGGQPYSVINSTFEGNIAAGWRGGGALFNNTAGITVINSTFYANVSTGGPGGGISLEQDTAILSLNNTLIANSIGSDCYNPGTTTGVNNLIDDTTCGLSNGVDGNLIGLAPNLGLLADNGGRTQTMALLPGSPAIDAGHAAMCTAMPVNSLDQRGVSRPQHAQCDIGAYEYMTIVTTTANSGVGSLRQALLDAVSGDTIIFDSSLSGLTITLTSTLTIDKNVTIDGSALASPIAMSGNDTVRVFYVNSGVSATLNSLKVVHGRTSVTGGAGLLNYGALTVMNSTFTANTTELVIGGGIDNLGALTVTNSIFDSNSSWDKGAGIENLGTLKVSQSTFSNNQATVWGGGINNDGALTVTSSTFVSNRANAACGGAISGGGSVMTIVNSTFYSNTTVGNCGTLFNNASSQVTVTNSTFASNSGGGIRNDFADSTLNLINTIIADPTGPNCYNLGTLGTARNNLIQSSESACGLPNGVSGNQIGVNPLLGPLANNGGRTQTIALLPNSPAIGAGDDAICVATLVNSLDQRGVSRLQGAHCDIGAYESRGFTLIKIGGDNQSATIGTLFANPLVISVTSAYAEPVNGGLITFAGPLSGAGINPITTTVVITEGIASGSVTANAITGAYTVTANASGATSRANFFLINDAVTPGIFEFTDPPMVITATASLIPIQGRVAPLNSLTELTVTVDATPILTETYAPGTVLSKIFEAAWMPLLDGVYSLTAQATDEVSGTSNIDATLFVDTTPPLAVLNGGVYTSTAYAPGTGLRFNGSASDATGIVSATAALALGGDQIPLNVVFDETATPAGYLNRQAVYSHTDWSAAWWALDHLPNNVTGTLKLTLFDPTLAPVIYTFPITVDVVPPDWGEVVITANGKPITTGLTYTDSSLSTSVNVPPVLDGSIVSLWYGWTETYTVTLADLTPAVNPSVGLSLTQEFTHSVTDGGVARFFHLRAMDAYGNERAAVFGPYYHDLPGMPDYIRTPEMSAGFTDGVYRAWQTNSCTLQGVDQRIPSRGLSGAALSTAQAFYLTWNDNQLHFVWQGANWDTDGDLFIYLDTLPDQANPYQRVGSGAAYNPYTSTYSSTVLLLPTEEWSKNPSFIPPANAPAVNGMHADYALWVKNSAETRVLRWDNAVQQWADDGNLNDLGGAYALNSEVNGAFTDLVVPLALVGNPQNWIAPFSGLGPKGMGVIAFAVDAEEGAGSGLRLWSVLPYANPADSTRVVPNAPAASQPHLLMLTNRYIVPVTDGACFQPESDLQFYLSADVDAFAYNGFADDLRLILPAPAVKPTAWDGLFDPYDDIFRAWLSADYCPTHPTYSACRTGKPPAELGVADLLATLIASQHPSLSPGTPVTYTLSYVNPAETLTNTIAYLYSNNNLNNPQSGVAFAGQSWTSGCAGWLSLELQPGSGQLILTGTVQSAGVSTVTLDIAPSYSLGAGCSIVPGDGTWPAQRLTVQHTPDDGPPAYVAIEPELTVVGPVSTTISGVVEDASPVSLIEVQVNGSTSFSCPDAAPTDGQWECLWDIPASNGGTPPANGTLFTLRARATDAFGHTSAWSEPQPVVIDTQAPQFGSGSGSLLRLADSAVATPPLLGEQVIHLSGVISDNTVPRSVELCDAVGENCALPALELDPVTMPPIAYNYVEVLTTPVAIDGNALCGASSLGLVRTFDITDSFTIGSLQVGLRVAHPYRSDLSARLRSPSGAEITLFSFTKNVLAENINALFTDRSLNRLPSDVFSHDLNASFELRPFRPENSLSVFNGENAAGRWTLTLCDRDAPNDTGAYYEAALDFTAVAPPLNVTGDWHYTLDASGSDGTVYTWRLYATDMNGNRSAQPYSLTVQVDNVAPIITATQIVTEVLIGHSAEVLQGTVSDGDVVSATWLLVTDPLGNIITDNVVGATDSWIYNFTPTLGGEYRLAVYAVDRAGNQASVGTFSLTTLQPLELQQAVAPQDDVIAGSIVTYTFWMANYNATAMASNLVITSTLNRWLTPVNTAGAIVIEAQPDNLLVWPATSLAAGGMLSFTVLARMPNELIITDTQPLTQLIDLRGATFTSLASLTTGNLGPSQAYQTSFVAAGTMPQPQESVIEIDKEVTPTLAVNLGSIVTYTIRITNTTNITAENVVVSDTLNLALTPLNTGGAIYNSASRTLTWPARTLASGEGITLTFSAHLTTNQSLVDSMSGFIENQAAISSSLDAGLSNFAAFWTPRVYLIMLPLISRNASH